MEMWCYPKIYKNTLSEWLCQYELFKHWTIVGLTMMVLHRPFITGRFQAEIWSAKLYLPELVQGRTFSYFQECPCIHLNQNWLFYDITLWVWSNIEKLDQNIFNSKKTFFSQRRQCCLHQRMVSGWAMAFQINPRWYLLFPTIKAKIGPTLDILWHTIVGEVKYRFLSTRVRL